MKGFPNQVANLGKLAKGMQCLLHLVESGGNARDHGVFGEALVRAGVAGTGRPPMPIDEYLRNQRENTPSNQSFRTTARQLKELYRLLGFITDTDLGVEITDLGRQVAGFADTPLDEAQRTVWRRVIGNIHHYGGEAEASHPYQVLLRLIARKPGITRAMCALALEAKNDSEEELERVVALAGHSEARVQREIHVSESNWDNAKKILPSFAEQLRDVVKTGHTFRLADAPGQAGAELPAQPAAGAGPARRNALRPPRSARQVSRETIGRAGIEDRSDEVDVAHVADPAAAAEAVRIRRERLRRHNTIVRALAEALPAVGPLLEDPFDLLKIIDAVGILAEIKTLDGSAADERERVRDALSQLLYYEAFVAAPLVGRGTVRKVACFERPISVAHREWLNGSGIAVIWLEGERFRGDALAIEFLRGYLEELG